MSWPWAQRVVVGERVVPSAILLTCGLPLGVARLEVRHFIASLSGVELISVWASVSRHVTLYRKVVLVVW